MTCIRIIAFSVFSVAVIKPVYSDTQGIFGLNRIVTFSNSTGNFTYTDAHNLTNSSLTVERDIQEGLQLYVREQRAALAKLEDEISRANFGPWLKNMAVDFDSTDHSYVAVDGTTNIYRVMLKTATSTNKLENLLFLTHDNGVKYCAENYDNGTLLTIHDAEESKDILYWLHKKLRIPAKIWLAASKVRKVQNRNSYYNGYDSSTWKAPLFMWDDTSKLMGFSNWHTGKSVYNGYSSDNFGPKCEPSDNGENENCIEMLSSYYPYPTRCDTTATAGQWNDIPCDSGTKNVIVCKKVMK